MGVKKRLEHAYFIFGAAVTASAILLLVCRLPSYLDERGEASAPLFSTEVVRQALAATSHVQGCVIGRVQRHYHDGHTPISQPLFEALMRECESGL